MWSDNPLVSLRSKLGASHLQGRPFWRSKIKATTKGKFVMLKRLTQLVVTLAAVCVFQQGATLAQQCQGCECAGNPNVYPVYTYEECFLGRGAWELVCTGPDGQQKVVNRGINFTGRPKVVPKDCTLRFIPGNAHLTGHPANGCRPSNPPYNRHLDPNPCNDPKNLGIAC